MALPPTDVSRKMRKLIKDELSAELTVPGSGVHVSADNVLDGETNVSMTKGERDITSRLSPDGSVSDVPGFAHSWLAADGSCAGGVRGDGTMDVASAKFGELNGIAGEQVAEAARSFVVSFDVPGFALALMAADGSCAGGVRTDGTIDGAALNIISAVMRTIAAETLSASSAEITTLNAANVDDLIQSIATTTDFAPLLQRPDLQWPIKAKSAFLARAAQVGGAGGWSCDSGSLAVDGAVTVAGRSTVKYQGNSNDYPTVRVAVESRPLPVQGRIVWRFKTDANIGSFSQTLAYSSDAPNADPPSATPTNRRSVTIQPAQSQRGVWNSYVQDVDAASLTPGVGSSAVAWVDSGAPNAHRAQALQSLFSFPTSTPIINRQVWLDRPAISGLAVPFALLTFDGLDTSGASLDKIGFVLKAFRDRGLVGTQFMDGGQIAANKAILQLLADAGWDIGFNGGPGHINYTTAGAGADQAAREAKLSTDYDNFLAEAQAAGFTTLLDAIAWPQAAHNAGLDAVMYSKGCRFSRGGSAPPRIVVCEDGSPEVINDGTLTTTYHYGTDGAAFSAAQGISWNDDAVLHGTGYCSLTHFPVVGTSTSTTETSSTAWLAWLDDLAAKRQAGKMLCLTVSQYLRMTNCPRPLYA